jgi:hypothetical protein
MRIQIRSFVTGGNHGQYLQALGLRSALMRLLPGADVTHLGYNNHLLRELRVQWRGGHTLKYLSMRWFWAKNFRFSPFDWDHDLTVYGSDMIWHLESPLFPADTVFFGKGDRSPRIAYAPSVGFRGATEPPWVPQHLKQFGWIGVRDETTADFVEDHAGVRPCLVIDPCFFLLSTARAASWTAGHARQGLVVYSPETKAIVRAVAEQTGRSNPLERFGQERYLGYQPKSMPPSPGRYVAQLRDPLNVLDEIAKAELLLTSTFHGVMMALMTSTPFIALRSRSLDARLESPVGTAFSRDRLMEREALQQMTIADLDNFCHDRDIDSSALASYTEESLHRLDRAIAEIVEPATHDMPYTKTHHNP